MGIELGGGGGRGVKGGGDFAWAYSYVRHVHANWRITTSTVCGLHCTLAFGENSYSKSRLGLGGGGGGGDFAWAYSYVRHVHANWRITTSTVCGLHCTLAFDSYSKGRLGSCRA